MTNSFKSPKQKFGVAEKKLCVHVAQKVKWCLQKPAKFAEKVALCRQKSSLWCTKKYFLSTKKSRCRTKKSFMQKNDNSVSTAQKNVSCPKKLLSSSGTARNTQKQPPRCVLKKKCSENMQQIYRRTPMPKCVFNQRTALGGCFLILLLMWES